MGAYPAPQTVVETRFSYSVRPAKGLQGGVATALQWDATGPTVPDRAVPVGGGGVGAHLAWMQQGLRSAK